MARGAARHDPRHSERYQTEHPVDPVAAACKIMDRTRDGHTHAHADIVPSYPIFCVRVACTQHSTLYCQTVKRPRGSEQHFFFVHYTAKHFFFFVHVLQRQYSARKAIKRHKVAGLPPGMIKVWKPNSGTIGILDTQIMTFAHLLLLSKLFFFHDLVHRFAVFSPPEKR